MERGRVNARFVFLREEALSKISAGQPGGADWNFWAGRISQSAQIVTAIFFVNVENILISQFVCHKLKNLKMTKCSNSLKSSCITWILVWEALCGVFLSQLVLKKQDQNRGTKRSNNSLDMIEMSGLICGSVSSVFYLGSRFPQLYKNFQRRTEGISYLLFALAMMGNCTYGLSLVFNIPVTKNYLN